MRLELSVPVDIRPLEAADLEGLAWESEQAIHADYIRRTLDERADEVVFLLAVVDRRPVGRIGIDFGRKADEGVVHLWAFGVFPALQGFGIGTALLREAEAFASRDARGTGLFEIGVEDWNTGAMRLYRRLGYRDWKTEVGEQGESIILLRREA